MTRLYWLKLKDDFFRQKEIKRLRMIAGGDTYTIIYLKLLLLSLSNSGEIYYDAIGDSFINELALELDEKPDNVDVTVKYLISKGMIDMENSETMVMSHLPEMIGSESDSAKRVRKHRTRVKQLQCNDKMLQGNRGVTGSNTDVTQILDIDKEIEIDTDNDGDEPISQVVFPTKDGKDFVLKGNQYLAVKTAYPLLDIEHQLKQMKAWIVTNPERLKTFKGMPRFINSWLSRSANINTERTDVKPQWFEDQLKGTTAPPTVLDDEERKRIIQSLRQ